MQIEYYVKKKVLIFQEHVLKKLFLSSKTLGACGQSQNFSIKYDLPFGVNKI